MEDGDPGSTVGISSQCEGGHCHHCGEPQTRTRRYNDGVITTECLACGATNSYRIERCGPGGCRGKFVPDE